MGVVVGKRIPRYDGLQHVTGRTQFVDDVSYPNMLWVKAYRSPVVKGEILNVDVSQAEKTPGVAAVLTAKDVPANQYGFSNDQPVLAEKGVRFKGEAIVAVAAVDEDTAQEAVEKIRVDFKEETPVFDPIEAMKPDTPRVRPEGNLWMFGEVPYRRIRLGDVEKGFKEADVIVEEVYRTQNQDHAQLEGQVSVARLEANGVITINSVSQCPFLHQLQLAGILKVPLNRLKFIGGTVGGGFGSKNDMHADHITSLLALKTGKPVKWRWTREEEFLASTVQGAWIMEYKDGVKKDGRIVARKIRAIRDAGAYGSLNPYVVDKHCFLVCGPYAIPNVWIDGYCVFTNKQVSSSMRGFGITPASFSNEVQMDKIAEAVGKDPWEIRFINAVRDGDITATRKTLESVALIETMKEAAKAAGIQLPDHLMAMSSEKKEV
ncbi:MAG: molybdopterin-dependent oxidoreductase [Thermodesulfobacteriota bacterium]|nr:molybdopterin-dependent oxidoreductase [Thermodesulfobacteriota bacterium]